MKKRHFIPELYFLFALCLLFVASACDNSDDPTPATINRTVLVYVMGDNSLQGLISNDVSEMIEGAANVDLTRNNLLVYTDNGTTAKLFQLVKNQSGKIVEEVVRTYGKDRNSVGKSEMQEVLSLVYTQYPADSYGLVLWSHGDGWVPGTADSRWIGQDWSGNARLSISTLSDALSVIPYYDYILFDACFMQSIEVAYELRYHTGYFVGSPAEIPGPGAPYQKVVPALFATNDAAFSVARAYYDYYDESYDEKVQNTNAKWTAGVAISVIASDKLEQLAKATSDILPSLITNGQEVSVTNILNYDKRSAADDYDYVGYYDFDAFMKKQTNGDASYTTWAAALSEAVPYAASTAKIYSMYTRDLFSMTGYSGVSIYVPHTANGTLNASYRLFDWYADAGWSKTGW